MLLVGSYTSSWDIFIDETDDSAFDLWMALKEECEPKKDEQEAKGISEGNRKLLEAYLSKRYAIPFSITVHVPKIDEDTDILTGLCHSVFNF